MSLAVFLSHWKLYQGNYLLLKYDNTNEFNYGMHYHDFYEVQFYSSDAGTLVINGKEYLVKSGDIALINLFESHMLILNPNTYRHRYALSLGPNFLLSSCSDSSNLLSIFNHNNKNYPIIHFNEHDFDHFKSLLSRYSNIQITHGRNILERSVLYEILANLYNHFYDESQTSPADTQSVATIIKLVRYIDDHISEDLSLERLAAEVNFSKFYTCRIFKKHTGYTLTKYIVSKRIEKSKYLLKESMSISDISKSAGFNNYSYFYKTFKKSYGVTPTEYKAAFP